ncbi:MAG: YkgJ family cysteine cluster protein [Phycisphaerales bacterium]|nr:YkgJ family cysteine cluster protein [Phycisphaerales bacterium]
MTRGGSREWYSGAGGASRLRFECTQCGACCTGPEGAVLVTPREVDALAARLGMTTEAFVAQFTHMTPEGRSLIERETAPKSGQFDCVFLDRSADPSRGTCSVYMDRPTQCRTFPWWPDNLKDEAAWRRTAKCCEGIGRGAFVPISTIRIQRDAQAAAHPVHRG